MAIECIEKLHGHWRTVVIWDESDLVAFWFDECIFCSYRTHSADVLGRCEEIKEHENAHPRESEVRDFYEFRRSLHSLAMRLFPYFGLEALQSNDTEQRVKFVPSRLWRRFEETLN